MQKSTAVLSHEMPYRWVNYFFFVLTVEIATNNSLTFVFWFSFLHQDLDGLFNVCAHSHALGKASHCVSLKNTANGISFRSYCEWNQTSYNRVYTHQKWTLNGSPFASNAFVQSFSVHCKGFRSSLSCNRVFLWCKCNLVRSFCFRRTSFPKHLIVNSFSNRLSVYSNFVAITSETVFFPLSQFPLHVSITVAGQKLS